MKGLPQQRAQFCSYMFCLDLCGLRGVSGKVGICKRQSRLSSVAENALRVHPAVARYGK